MSAHWTYPVTLATDPIYDKWRSVWCPACGAPPGAFCVTIQGRRRKDDVHSARVKGANEDD